MEPRCPPTARQPRLRRQGPVRSSPRISGITATTGQLTPSRGRMPALPETDLAKIQKYCRAQVPVRLRDQVRIEATVRGGSVTTSSTGRRCADDSR